MVLILTFLITFAIVYRLKGSPPKETLDVKVWYTDKFRLRVPEDLANVALWNEQAPKTDFFPAVEELILDFGEIATREVPDKGARLPGRIQVPSNGRSLLPNKPKTFAPRSDNPSEFVLSAGKENRRPTRQLLAEFHSHTKHSDGRLEPPQLVDWAVAYGFQVLFVTDHNTITGGLAARKYAEMSGRSQEILVIPGVEFTCCRIHMNLLGINETIKPSGSWPNDEELIRVIRQTHELGGIVIANHLPWSQSLEYGRDVPTLQRHPTREQLRDWGVDGFECVAEGVLDLATIRFAESENMPYITATDIHNPEDMPHAWTVLNVPVDASADPHDEFHPARGITEQDILNLLRSRKPGATNFYYDPIGPHSRTYPPLNPSREWFLPLTTLDFTYFWSENSGMYSFVNGFCHDRVFRLRWRAILGFIGWCLLALFMYEAIRFVGLMAWHRIGRKPKSVSLR